MTGILDDHIGIGSIIEIVVVVAGLIGGYATMKAMQKVQEKQLSELKEDLDEDCQKNSDRHDANVGRMSTLEIKIANECLKKDDFREFERKFDVKIERLEHATGNAVTKAAGMIVDLLRTQGRLRDDR